MLLSTTRRLDTYLRTTETVSLAQSPIGLTSKNITILGNGNIGKRVTEICRALEMNVTIFKRGDDLLKAVKDADIIVDVLSTNSTSKGLLNRDFFQSVKEGAIFISVTVAAIVDFNAMFEALDSGKLSLVAHDVADAKPGDSTNTLYKKLRQHPKVYTTPHIAGFSDTTTRIGNNMMIDNIEAWLQDKPINVFKR